MKIFRASLTLAVALVAGAATAQDWSPAVQIQIGMNFSDASATPLRFQLDAGYRALAPRNETRPALLALSQLRLSADGRSNEVRFAGVPVARSRVLHVDGEEPPAGEQEAGWWGHNWWWVALAIGGTAAAAAASGEDDSGGDENGPAPDDVCFVNDAIFGDQCIL